MNQTIVPKPVPSTRLPTDWEVRAHNVFVALQSGYEAEDCKHCGHLKLRQVGTCLRCENCGETTGC